MMSSTDKAHEMTVDGTGLVVKASVNGWVGIRATVGVINGDLFY